MHTPIFETPISNWIRADTARDKYLSYGIPVAGSMPIGGVSKAGEPFIFAQTMPSITDREKRRKSALVLVVLNPVIYGSFQKVALKKTDNRTNLLSTK